MYNNYLKILPVKQKGSGVFCTVNIPEGVPILQFIGNYYQGKNLPDHPANLQIDYDMFIGPSGQADDYINHSCSPNCYLQIVGNKATLYSLYMIVAETELTFDYSTTSTDTYETWKMDCNCKSGNCRKIISGFHYLDQETQNQMKQKGMIPMFLMHNIFRRE